MDKGGKASNPKRVVKPAISAIQTAMNIYIADGAAVFASEYQNEPLKSESPLYSLNVADVAKQVNKVPQHQLPPDCEWLVVGVDINPQTRGINWTAVGATNKLATYVTRYDVYPRDGVLFDQKNPKGQTLEQAIWSGLDVVCRQIEDIEFTVDGKRKTPDCVLIDVGGPWMDCALTFCSKADYSFPVKGSRGRSDSQWRPARVIGRSGDNVFETKWEKGRVVVHNSDVWRERVQQGFRLPVGAPGSVSIYGDKPELHEWFAKQITSKKLIQKVAGPVKTVWSWSNAPGAIDDQLDSTKIAMSGLNWLGASVAGERVVKKKRQIIRKSGKW
jgi:hypothetical protein